MGWSLEKRNILLISGFIFDFIFSLEFVVRTIASTVKKNFWGYFWYRRGWVDFLSSIPLLLLNSGPALYIYLTGDMSQIATGIGVLNILKIIKAIRVTRVLRLVRIIKIFGKIHNTNSPMAQHHTSTVTTTAVFSIILSLLIFSVAFHNQCSDFTAERQRQYTSLIDTLYQLEKDNITTLPELATSTFKKDQNLLRLNFEQKDIFPFDAGELGKKYSHDDFQILEYKDFLLYISIRDLNIQTAKTNLQHFFMIIMVVLSFTFIFTRHFAQNVTDILHIMNLGMRKKDYNLQVKINPHYSDHELFKLAQFYNDAYLPAKLKRMNKEKEQSLSMNDLLKFNK